MTQVTKSNVMEYLEKFGDRNQYHQEPYKIIPGMFYLHLIEDMVQSPIKDITIKFRKPAKYPANLEVELAREDGKVLFNVTNQGEKNCSGSITLSEAHSPNTSKFETLHRIPVELQQAFSSEAQYLSQTMEFLEPYNEKDSTLEFELVKLRENGLANLNITQHQNNRIIGTGKTVAIKMSSDILANAIQ